MPKPRRNLTTQLNGYEFGITTLFVVLLLACGVLAANPSIHEAFHTLCLDSHSGESAHQDADDAEHDHDEAGCAIEMLASGLMDVATELPPLAAPQSAAARTLADSQGWRPSFNRLSPPGRAPPRS